jgi:hypothetical protein
MVAVTHQTVRLAKGKHESPDEGACVMELASMLAGEPFTDHPASVSPMIGYLLRAYNDAVDDGRRQRLYPYAAKVVGSAASRTVEQARAARLTAELPHKPRRLSRFLLGPLAPEPSPDRVAAGIVSRLKPNDDRGHRKVLDLVDELIALGDQALESTSTNQLASRPMTPVPH